MTQLFLERFCSVEKASHSHGSESRGGRPNMPFLDFWSTSSALYGADEGAALLPRLLSPRLLLKPHYKGSNFAERIFQPCDHFTPQSARSVPKRYINNIYVNIWIGDLQSPL